jgi:integrase
MAYESLYRCVKTIGKRAGIAGKVTPHTLRHAFGDHVTRYAGLKTAQFVLGHESVSTTERYTGEPTLDEVGEALAAFGYGEPSAKTGPSKPLAATGDRFGLY